MDAVRADMVTDLVEDMIIALTTRGEEASANEMMSACFTITLRMMKGCVALGADAQQMRSAVEVLLLQCASSSRPN